MQKINDFGKKIGGAKKDLWKERNMIFEDTIEMTEAEKRKYVKRDNIWKKIDTEELLEKGYPRLIVFWLKEMRACIYPDMKRTYISIKEYIQAIEKIRDIVMKVKTEDDINLAWKKILCEEGVLYKTGPCRYSYAVPYYGIANGNKFLKLHEKDALDRLKMKMEKTGFGLSKTEFLSKKYDIVEFDEETVKVEHERFGIQKGKPCIAWKISGKTYPFYSRSEEINLEEIKKGQYLLLCKESRDVLFYGSKPEVLLFKDTLIDLLIAGEKRKTKRKGKKKLVPKQLENIERKGKDYRHGHNIVGDDFLNAFKIRGGEFGNYTNDKDRQANLNMAYEAFCDLADALEISREDIGLVGLETGALGIAFGARGHGNALAHYEPGREVINLTKLRGAGSLAHEWGHAFDDFLGKIVDSHIVGHYATNMLRIDAIPESFKTLIHRLIRNEDNTFTEFYMNAEKIDQGATKTENGYWKSKVELFARAFACYVKDKLRESGKRNDYLCGHADLVNYESEEGLIAAYPTGEERKRFFVLFNQLFVELKQLGYLHEPIDDYEFNNNSHSQFKDLASENNINLDNATQLTFADFGI